MATATLLLRGRRVKRELGGTVRYSWGYHDARDERARGKARRIVEAGPQGPAQVSREYDSVYAAGYAAGLDSAADARSSEPSWLAYRYATARAAGRGA